MAKMASYMSMREGGFRSALDIAKQQWPSDTELHAHIQKTNIPAGTTTETNWATELVEPTTLGSEFLQFLRAQTIVGKFGMNGVPALRSLPFNVRIPRMTSGLTGYWVGEGLAKPVSKGAVDAVLTDALAKVSASWPGVQVEPERFAAHVAARLPGAGSVEEALRALALPDLYLACACAAGQSVALEAFESELMTKARTSLARSFERQVQGGGARGADAAVPSEALRDFGLGAQVLADLGCRRIRLLSNTDRKIVGIQGFGIDVIERVPIPRVKTRTLVAHDGGSASGEGS